MSWQTPKTDWAAPDGVRYTDFNRIEGNILELRNAALNVDRTVYVNRSTGNDSNDGSASRPYATISKALSSIPYNLNGKAAMISIAQGTYNESINIVGYIGTVILTGTAGSYVYINGLRIDGCVVNLQNINLVAAGSVFVTGRAALYGDGNLSVDGYTLTVNYCSLLQLGTVNVNNASNQAINVNRNSRFYADTIGGAGNNIGIACQSGSILAYGVNNLASNTLASVTSNGGRIYTGAQSLGGF